MSDMTRAVRTTIRHLLATSGAAAICTFAVQTPAADDELPFYYERPIPKGELRGKTLRELQILSATIHARAGLVFLEVRLRDYFARTVAYRPGGYDASRLSAVDEQNLRTIAAYRASIPHAELKRRWDGLLLEHRYSGHTGRQHLVDFSADGSVIVAGPSGARETVSFFRTANGERIGKNAWAGQYLHAVRLAGSNLVVIGEYDAITGDWHSPHPRRSLLIGMKARPNGDRDPPPHWACISPDGTRVVAESSGAVATFDLITRKQGIALPLPRGGYIPNECSFTSARTAFVRAHQYHPGYILDLDSQILTPLAVPPGNSVISRDGSWLARWDETIPGKTGDIEIWTLRDAPRRLQVLSGSAGTYHATFSPDGANLLTSDLGGRLVHWNLTTAKQTLWRDRTEYWRSNTLAAIEDSLDVPEIFDLSEDRPTPRECMSDSVTSMLFSPDGTQVLITYEEGNLELRDARSGQPITAFRGHHAWTDEDLWEVTLLAERLGLPLDPMWPRIPEFVDPLRHLSALDGRLPEGVIRKASRVRLRFLRNAIYARRGAPLESPMLLRWFADASWYKPSATYTPARLTPIDRDNIMRIKRREQALGGSITDSAIEAELARNAGPVSG